MQMIIKFILTCKLILHLVVRRKKKKTKKMLEVEKTHRFLAKIYEGIMKLLRYLKDEKR